MAEFNDQTLIDLRSRLAGTRAGSTTVVEAMVEPRFDLYGEEYVQVTLVVSEPPAGQDIWPLDDAFELRQAVRRVSDDLGITSNVEITITSSDEDPSDDAGEGGPSAPSGGFR